MLGYTTAALVIVVCIVGQASAQTFRRLGTCPKLGCVFPPDQTNFLTGQYFDIRLEVHAPVNGSEASHGGVPDEKFTFCVQRANGPCTDAAKFFSVKEPQLEKWTFRCGFVLVLMFPSSEIETSSATLKTCSRKMLASLPLSMLQQRHTAQ